MPKACLWMGEINFVCGASFSPANTFIRRGRLAGLYFTSRQHLSAVGGRQRNLVILNEVKNLNHH